MNCLEELAPRVEQYSIDEMFLDLTGVEHCMGLEDFGRQLRQHVYDCTRLTIGVGLSLIHIFHLRQRLQVRPDHARHLVHLSFLRALLCQGMGRGKAYGLGLMTVMRGGN